VTATVAWIHTAPIKALAIEERERVHLGKLGVAGDRRFCVVDPEGKMINAKRVPALVAVRPSFTDDGSSLTLRMPDGSSVSGDVALGHMLPVTIFGRECEALAVTGPFSDALSTLAGRPLRLVRFAMEGEGVDRSDELGAATLLSQASLEEIGRVAGADRPVDPRRFRMLFGVAGVPAHAEDAWIGRRVRIGEAVVTPLGNVGRCAVTTVDPVSGRSDLDTLGALAKYRSGTVTTEPLAFGVWARVDETGDVALGDLVVA
jgi:uncharacterized protein YcbX